MFFSILWLPDWITNKVVDWLTRWTCLNIYRGYRWLEWWKLFKTLGYSKQASEIMAILDKSDLSQDDFNEANILVNKLIDRILFKAIKILGDFDEQIEQKKIESVKTWKCYINLNNWKIIWIALFFKPNCEFPSEFIITNTKEWEKQKKHYISMLGIGFDAAFELAIEKLCEFHGIELTPEIRETLMKAKEKYPRKRSDSVW